MREHFPVSADMMICRHEERDCIYDEAEVCQALRLDDSARINAHMQRYRAMGYPAHNGLYTNVIIARWHDRANVRAMCELWWEEYRRGSSRDQLSLNYAIWKSEPIKDIRY
ncbi:MAG: glycosyltransferase domain-containing protein [Pyrinomonadaceae bacterium]